MCTYLSLLIKRMTRGKGKKKNFNDFFFFFLDVQKSVHSLFAFCLVKLLSSFSLFFFSFVLFSSFLSLFFSRTNVCVCRQLFSGRERERKRPFFWRVETRDKFLLSLFDFSQHARRQMTCCVCNFTRARPVFSGGKRNKDKITRNT